MGKNPIEKFSNILYLHNIILLFPSFFSLSLSNGMTNGKTKKAEFRKSKHVSATMETIFFGPTATNGSGVR